jgi:uncharacterized protein (TIGR00369 family)
MGTVGRSLPKALKLEDDHFCFVCGSKNQSGLHLTFTLDGSTMRTVFTPQKNHQGFANIVHGGIIATVLDEIMLNLLYRMGIPAVTGELQVRFLNPCLVNEKLYFEASVIDNNGRLVQTAAQAKNEQGDIVARAQAKCVVRKS